MTVKIFSNECGRDADQSNGCQRLLAILSTAPLVTGLWRDLVVLVTMLAESASGTQESSYVGGVPYLI